MGRVLAVIALAVVAGLGVVAAPALSTDPYMADPVDFSADGPPALGDPDPGEGIVSEPLRAPKRFNLVGMSWNGGGEAPRLALRTRVDGGDWSPWTPIDTHAEDGPDPGLDDAAHGMSNPVWAGEADWVQYRSSRPLHGVRLHFVNTDGSATATDRIANAVRGALNAAIVSAASLLSADTADADEPQPTIVPRSRWAGDNCKPRSKPAYGEVRAAYVHHTVNTNGYTRAEAPQIVLGMCRYHRNTNGWSDIGYNFLVDRFGTIYEGRAGGIAAAVIGAQAEGYNSLTTGIANIGTYSTVPQSDAALDAMARLIRWKLPLHGYPTDGQARLVSAGGATNRYRSGSVVRVKRVLGHRDTNATECPGGALHAQLDELRQRVGGIDPSGTATRVEAELDAPRATIDHGQAATISGRVTDRDGNPVAGRPVAVQMLADKTWRTLSTPVTDDAGGYALTVKPRVTRQLRVRFAGAGELRASVSPTLTLAVRPAIRVAEPARRVRPRTRVTLRGRVVPRTRRVQQVLRLLVDDRYRVVGRKWVKVGRRGHFRSWFAPAGKGLYRVQFVTAATALRAAGRSQAFDIGAGVRPPSPAEGGGAVARR